MYEWNTLRESTRDKRWCDMTPEEWSAWCAKMNGMRPADMTKTPNMGQMWKVA